MKTQATRLQIVNCIIALFKYTEKYARTNKVAYAGEYISDKKNTQNFLHNYNDNIDGFKKEKARLLSIKQYELCLTVGNDKRIIRDDAGRLVFTTDNQNKLNAYLDQLDKTFEEKEKNYQEGMLDIATLDIFDFKIKTDDVPKEIPFATIKAIEGFVIEEHDIKAFLQ